MLFNETVFNIIQNFIPHDTVTFDDRNPSWITSRIKKMINNKNLAFKPLRIKKVLQITAVTWKGLVIFSINWVWVV